MRSTLGKNLHLCFTKSPPPSPEDCDHRRPLYMNNYNSHYSYTALDPSTSSSSSTSLPSESDPAQEPDFAAVFASQRFFFSSPGSSNSITDSSPSTSRKDHPTVVHVKDSVAVSTDSPDPYLDFRRSMQEMVEARGLVDVKANWESLHELLLCYLSLNPKSTHKFIVGAFADLLVTLMSLAPQPPGNKTDHREDSSPVVVRFRGGSCSV